MADRSPQLTIHLFGTPEIEIAGVPLPLNAQKARALLFYLAATERAHTRNHLATLLWSESSTRNAYHSLRSTLYVLRRAVRDKGQADSLISRGNLVELKLDSKACDTTRFRRLLKEDNERALSEVVSLYRGPFLQGFTLSNAPEFEEWARFEEDQLSQAYVRALERLATWAEARQAWAEAIDYVRRILHVDPLAEDAQRRLLKLYFSSGAVGLALRHYQQFEIELQQELGVRPAPETQALLRETLSGHTQALQRPLQKRNALQSPQQLPFVGREELLAQLVILSQSVSAGQGLCILIQGEAGIGKSRLINELVATLSNTSPPWMVLAGSCSPFDELVSYSPFLEALQTAPQGDLTELVSERGNVNPDARDSFFYRILQTLRLLSRNAPLLLAIDDLHWASSSTLNLFGFLATQLRNLPLMLVGTVQHAEAIPTLQRLITIGRPHGQLSLLNVPPLSQEHIALLLQAIGVSPASIELLGGWLHQRAGGNPLVVDEILAQLRVEEVLRPRDAGWQLDTGRWLHWRATFSLPETTHDLVSWRLSQLPPAARYLLDVLAVAGEPLPFDLLQTFPGLDPEQLLPTLEHLLARRFVLEADNQSFTLPHHLMRETLLHRMSNLRRRKMHRDLAEALETCPSLQEKLPVRQLAFHAVAGEDGDRARRYGLLAVQGLLRDYAGAETAKFLHNLYDLLMPVASSEEMIQLTHALGQLHQAIGDLQDSEHWYRESLDCAQAAGHPTAQATIYFEMSELALVRTDYIGAASMAQNGLALLGRSSEVQTALMGRGHRLLGAALAMEGSDLATAERHLQEAVAAHRRAVNSDDLCATLFELGNVAAQRGEIERALLSYQEAAQAAEAGRVPYFFALARNNYAFHSLLQGRLAAAREAAAQGLKLAEGHDLRGALVHLYSTHGEIELYQAEWATAEEWFQRGLSLAEELGNLERQAGHRAGVALAVRGRGNLERAEELLQEALTLIAGHGYWHLRARILLWLAETLLLRGHLDEAHRQLDTALTTARDHGRMLLLIQGQRLLAQLLALGGDWPAADVLFSTTVDQAQALELVMEAARTKAVWGRTLHSHAPQSPISSALLAEARTTLMAHEAWAELAALQPP